MVSSRRGAEDSLRSIMSSLRRPQGASWMPPGGWVRPSSRRPRVHRSALKGGLGVTHNGLRLSRPLPLSGVCLLPGASARLPVDTYRSSLRGVGPGLTTGEALTAGGKGMENRRIGRAHPRAAGENVSVHPRSPKAVREPEKRRECAGGRKAAWNRLKQQNPEGMNPRGLALTKHR